MSTALVDEIALEEEFARARLSRATFGRLLRYFRPHAGRLALALGLEVVWVLCMLLDPRLTRWIVDGPLPAGDVGGVVAIAGVMGVKLVVKVALTVWELRMSTAIAVQVIHAVRAEVFAHVQRLSMRYFDRTKQGRIIARADRDVDSLERMVMWMPIVFVSLSFSLVLGFAWLCFSNWRLMLWLLPAMPALWVISRVFGRHAWPAYRRVRERHSAISAHVAESITGVRAVQAFGAEAREIARLDGFQRLYREAVVGSLRVAGAYTPSLLVVFHTLLIVTLVVGGQGVVAGTMTVGALFEFVLLLGFVFGPIEGLGGLYNESLIAGAAAERIFLLLDTAPEVADRAGAIGRGRLRGEVEFDHVAFSYDPAGRHGRQIDDVSFRVRAGTTVALVGHTGAGKTSVVNLLARFYECQAGVVAIDGHDVKTLRLDALHHQTGMVLQENFLFAGSVLDNLQFVRPDCTAEAAAAAFEALGCTEVLGQLAGGLDTEVGARGANLSQGARRER